MGTLKKTLLMFAGSLLLFYLLALIDEYENLLPGKVDQEYLAPDPYEIERILKKYLNDLSMVYIDPAPELIASLPLSDTLRKELVDEVEFLENDGRIQKLDFQNIWMKDVRQVAPHKVRVMSREVIGVRYLKVSDRSEIRALPPALFKMSYVMEYIDGRWLITRYDETGIQALNAGGK